MFKLGLIIGGLALLSSTAQAAVCPQFFPAGKAPQAGIVYCNSGYAIGYSARYKEPLWAAEYLTDDNVTQALALHGRGSFFSDTRLPLSLITTEADYRDSGYARGHMAPSGDMPTWLDRTQTYAFSNLIPQDPDMNSGPWNQIEQDVRYAALDDGELYIMTGPIFSGETSVMGPDKVAVPTALYKIVYDAMDGGTAAIVCQNDTPAQCQPIALDKLQNMLGFDPMPGLSKDAKTIPLIIEGWSKVIRRSQY